jgi:hypothetical protein
VQLHCTTTGSNFNWEDSRAFWEDKLLGGHTVKQMQEMHPWIKPFGKRDHFEGGRGQLTEKGAAQLHDLGAALRVRYVYQADGFLPRILNPSDMSVRATPVQRCFQSAAALLLGLYPAELRAATATRVPIYSRDPGTETMWSGEHACPAQNEVAELYKALYHAEHFTDDSEFKEIVQHIVKAFGVEESDATRLQLLEVC